MRVVWNVYACSVEDVVPLFVPSAWCAIPFWLRTLCGTRRSTGCSDKYRDFIIKIMWCRFTQPNGKTLLIAEGCPRKNGNHPAIIGTVGDALLNRESFLSCGEACWTLAIRLQIIPASTVHWVIKPLPPMRHAVFFRVRLRLRVLTTVALPHPILPLNVE